MRRSLRSRLLAGGVVAGLVVASMPAAAAPELARTVRASGVRLSAAAPPSAPLVSMPPRRQSGPRAGVPILIRGLGVSPRDAASLSASVAPPEAPAASTEASADSPFSTSASDSPTAPRRRIAAVVEPVKAWLAPRAAPVASSGTAARPLSPALKRFAAVVAASAVAMPVAAAASVAPEQAHAALDSFSTSLLWFSAVSVPVGLVMVKLRELLREIPFLPAIVLGGASILILSATAGAVETGALPAALGALGWWETIKLAGEVALATLGVDLVAMSLSRSKKASRDVIQMILTMPIWGLLAMAAGEEILFRWAGLGLLMHFAAGFGFAAMPAFMIGAVLSSLIFAGIHGYGNFWARFLPGLIWSSLYFMSGSLALVILAHFLINLIYVIATRIEFS